MLLFAIPLILLPQFHPQISADLPLTSLEKRHDIALPLERLP